MQKTILTAAALAAMIAAPAAADLQWVPQHASSVCAPTLEAWREEVGDRLIAVKPSPPGALRVVVRWTTGELQTVEASRTDDGRGVCVTRKVAEAAAQKIGE